MLHAATAVSWNGQAILISGPPGCGKSSLALEAIAHGAMLVADDQVVLRAEGNMLLASAPETTAGCLAIRGVGIFRLPHAPHATVHAEIALAAETPGWSEPRLDGQPVGRLSLPIGYRVTPALLRYLLLAHDGTRPDIWLQPDDWRPERRDLSGAA